MMMAKHVFTLKQPPIADAFDKQVPNLKGMWAVIIETEKESDRGMTLVLSSFLEEVIKRLLLAIMVASTPEKDFTEGPSAPISTFSSRIKMAHALGLVTDDERSDLNIIRELRNAFAHQVGANYAERSVKDQCRALKYTTTEDLENARDHFRTAAIALIIALSNRSVVVSKDR
jgi:mannitol operon repressor